MVGDESGPTSEISNQAVANGSLFGKLCGPLTAESVVIETTTIDLCIQVNQSAVRVSDVVDHSRTAAVSC